MDFLDIKSFGTEFAKIADKLVEHWLRELLLILAMCLIVFSSQFFLIPFKPEQQEFNLFLTIATIGYGIYWYLISGFVGLLLAMVLTHTTKIQQFFSIYNLIGLFIGSLSIVFSTAIVYIFFKVFGYNEIGHYCVFILSHLILWFLLKRIVKLITVLSSQTASTGQTKQPTG